MAARTVRVGSLWLPQDLVYKGTEWYQGKRAQPRRVGKRRT